MSNTSNRSFSQLVRPVDPATVAVLRAVYAAARALGHEYLLVGATARDLLLVNVLGRTPGRATRDIDFGLAIENWSQFTAFRESLVKGGYFRVNARAAQRLHYKHPTEQWELPVDIIPFGPIASEDDTIAWPPSHDVVMNVAGFEDALNSSVSIRIASDLLVNAASIPGLTILKLLAWSDRRRQTNKDASDLYTLLSSYCADAGNLDRLYEDDVDLLENAEFDVTLAGAQLLGRDVARICEHTSSRRIIEILDDGHGAPNLITQINQISDPFGERPELAEKLVEHFRRGVANPK